MIPVSTLYDEYIERRKFTEQKKKTPVEYIVPPPSRGSEQKHFRMLTSKQKRKSNNKINKTLKLKGLSVIKLSTKMKYRSKIVKRNGVCDNMINFALTLPNLLGRTLIFKAILNITYGFYVIFVCNNYICLSCSYCSFTVPF